MMSCCFMSLVAVVLCNNLRVQCLKKHTSPCTGYSTYGINLEIVIAVVLRFFVDVSGSMFRAGDPGYDCHSVTHDSVGLD